MIPLPETGMKIPPAEYAGQWYPSKIWAGLIPDSYRGQGVKILHLGTGIDINHPFLSWTPGYNIADGSNDIVDVNGHGTGVCGLVAGPMAIATHALAVPMKVTNEPDGSASERMLADGLTRGHELYGAKVAVASYDLSSSSAFKRAAAAYAEQGGVTVVAAGNSGAGHYHMPDPNIIAVSATAQDDSMPSWAETGGHWDISAPGVNILIPAMGGGLRVSSGTSWAAPIVASICACIKGIRPDYNVEQVFNCLMRFNFSKTRRVNAARAVYAALLRGG